MAVLFASTEHLLLFTGSIYLYICIHIDIYVYIHICVYDIYIHMCIYIYIYRDVFPYFLRIASKPMFLTVFEILSE